jgi:hypothetical protein
MEHPGQVDISSGIINMTWSPMSIHEVYLNTGNTVVAALTPCASHQIPGTMEQSSRIPPIIPERNGTSQNSKEFTISRWNSKEFQRIILIGNRTLWNLVETSIFRSSTCI